MVLGGLFAVIATVFVFRESWANSLSAGLARLIATCVSFAVCLPYLLIFPFTGLGMAVVIGFGAIVMILLGQRDHIVTTGITIAVVIIVAGLRQQEAWQQQFSLSPRYAHRHRCWCLLQMVRFVCFLSDCRGTRMMNGTSSNGDLPAHRPEADDRSPERETGAGGALKGEGICRRP